MPVTARGYKYTGSSLIRLGSKDAAVVVPPRAALDGMQGTYKPTDATTGVPDGTVLEEWGTANQTVQQTSGSLTLENKIIRCDIDWRSTGVLTIKNCLIRGWNKNWTSQSAWIRMDSNPGVRNVLVQDSTIRPDYPTPYANAFIGMDFIAKRNLIEDVTDGFGVRRPSNWGSDLRVQIYANIVRRMAYFTPDTPNNRANTHNDAIQVFGGWGIDIQGNVLLGTISDTAGTAPFGVGTGSGANKQLPGGGRGLTVTPTVGVRTDVTFRDNYLDYGTTADIAFTMGNDSSATTGQQSIITGNKFGRNQQNLTADGVTARRPIKIDNLVTIPGFSTVSNSVTTDTQGNVWEDNGAPILVYKGAY